MSNTCIYCFRDFHPSDERVWCGFGCGPDHCLEVQAHVACAARDRESRRHVDSLGRQLRAYRASRKLPMVDAARIAGLPIPTLSGYETGRLHIPQGEYERLIAVWSKHA